MSHYQFRFPQSLMGHIVDHALETPEIEVCGLIAARMSEVSSVYRIPNVAKDQTISFFMEPQAQIAALKTMRKYGEHLCGIYHSHPASDPLPSKKDLEEAAYPHTLYLIVSLKNGKPELGSFLFDGKGFRTVELQIV